MGGQTVCVLFLVSAACSRPSSDRATEPLTKTQHLIFSVTSPVESPTGDSGPIPGMLVSNVPPAIGATELAERLRECGASRFSIEEWSHVGYVSTPSGPNDLALVKCVQQKVDFGFAAGLGHADRLEEADYTAFRLLHD
jgi:hypothetical protein